MASVWVSLLEGGHGGCPGINQPSPEFGALIVVSALCRGCMYPYDNRLYVTEINIDYYFIVTTRLLRTPRLL